jgi:hypothetical protein
MSDVMLLGVLRMPMPDEPDTMTLRQFVSRARQAACRIEADADELAELRTECERLRAEVEMLREDAERLEYLMRHLPEDALRYVAGELADSGDIAEFRAAIDKVMAPNVEVS